MIYMCYTNDVFYPIYTWHILTNLTQVIMLEIRATTSERTQASRAKYVSMSAT